MLGLCAWGCHNEEHSEHDHEHEHVNVPYWTYNGEVEVFVDSEPLEKGSVSTLIVHLTDLNNFKPITPSELTGALIVGNDGLKQTVKSVQPGIFKLAFKPEVEGRGYLTFTFSNNGKDYNIKLDSVSVYKDDNAIHQLEENTHSPNQVTFTKEQSWKVDFATALPEMRPMGAVFKTTAAVEASPVDQLIVSAKTNGFVGFSRGLIAPGQFYKKNDVLLTIKGNGISDNNPEVMLKKAKAELELAAAEYERDALLAKKQIVSNKELLETKARFQKAQSEYNNLKKSIGEDGEKVFSQVSGYINEVFVNNGKYVEAGQPLFSMVEDRRLTLTAMVSQKHYKVLKEVSDLNIEIGDKVLTLADLNGRILSVGKAISGNHHMLPAIFEIDMDDDLLSGGFTNVYIKTKGKERLVIPESALTEDQGVYFVYVQNTPEKFQKRQVKIGVSDGQFREVTEGLSVNERVVSKGAILVKLASVSNSIDPHAGHVH